MPTPEMIASVIRAVMTTCITPERPSGCGRVYVIIGDKQHAKLVAKACKIAGIPFYTKAYGTSGNAIYIGYDNASGRPLAQGTLMVEKLQEIGISCYRDEVGD
jgi:hypothetical protein